MVGFARLLGLPRDPCHQHQPRREPSASHGMHDSSANQPCEWGRTQAHSATIFTASASVSAPFSIASYIRTKVLASSASTVRNGSTQLGGTLW